VIEAIQARQRAGLSIASVWRDDHVLYSAGNRCFGNWTAALRAAGLAALARPKWSREVVLRELRARYRPGIPFSRFWA
jgi:hypothetical protein